MASLGGYSFQQKEYLDGLEAQVGKLEIGTQTKLGNTGYTNKMNLLNSKDTLHSNKISELKNGRLVKQNYNDKLVSLDQSDSDRSSNITNLTAIYIEKTSKTEFEEKKKELDAISYNHDIRLDELEKRVPAIYEDFHERVVEEVAKKTANDIYNAFKTAIEAGHTGIAAGLTGLALQQGQIDSINLAQNTALAGKVSVSEFNTDMAKLDGKNYNIETRLQAIDEFFRVVEMTYRVNKTDNSQAIYTASLQSDLKVPATVIPVRRKYTGLVITLTPYRYNTLSGLIQIKDKNGNIIASLAKDNVESDLTGKAAYLNGVPSQSLFPLQIQVYDQYEDNPIENNPLDWPTFNGLRLLEPPPYTDTPINEAITFIAANFSSTTVYQQPTSPNLNANDVNYFGPMSYSVSDLTRYIWGSNITPYPFIPSMNESLRNLQIVAPSGLAGEDIDGDNIVDETMGTNSFSSDSVQGKAVMIQCGQVAFEDKALRAYEAGAKLVIIYNQNEDPYGNPDSVQALIGSIKASNIGCPVVFIGNSIGERIVKQVRGLIPGAPTPLYAKYGIGRQTELLDDRLFVYANLSQEPAYILSIAVPLAPKITAVNVAEAEAIISFTPPLDDGGSQITRYEYNINNGSWNTLNATRTIGGLAGGVTVDIRIRAVNTVGSGQGSLPVSVTPPIEKSYKVFGQTPFDVRNDGTIHCTAKDANGNIYIGGIFSLIDNVYCSNIARFDALSQTWSALGGGASGIVSTIAVSGSTVYVSGPFLSVSNTSGTVANTSYIAKWDGSTWSALGGGANGIVNAIAVSDSAVYVGGQFSSVSNTSGPVANTPRIAKWDGSTWSALGGGANGIVNAIAVSDSAVYVGGQFSSVSNTSGPVANTPRIAKWDGSTWSALGRGANGTVNAIAVSDSAVYVGGQFSSVSNTSGPVANTSRIAKWDGSTWSALGGGANGTVNAIAVSDSAVYVGGIFLGVNDNSGPVANTSYIAKWDGSTWSPVGGGLNGVPVNISVIGSKVYVCKNSHNDLVYFENNTWTQQVIAYLSGNIYAVSSDGLYIGGSFKYIGVNRVSNIAKWDGSTWSALGGGANDIVNDIAVSDSSVYVGGYFSSVSNTSGTVANTSRIAKWDGSTWSALGRGASDSVSTIAVSKTAVYVGGPFLSVSNTSGTVANTSRIAKWDGSTWSALGGGANGTVNAIAVSDSAVYVGGEFSSVSNTSGPVANTSRIAKWDGSTWSALGRGANNNVHTIAVSGTGTDTTIYVGGNFGSVSNTSGTVANTSRIAKWDGSTWSALGGGANSKVNTIAVSDSAVYVGGSFTTVSNTSGTVANTSYIAKWDGSTWSALGGGVNGIIRFILNNNGTLLIGGPLLKIGTDYYFGIVKYS